MENILEGCCSAYAIVVGKKIVGNIERHERPQAADDGGKPTGPLGKLRKGILKLISRDWCIELDDSRTVTDHRPMIAAMILLIEQTIANDRAT